MDAELGWVDSSDMDEREPAPRLLHNRFAADAVGSSPTRAEETCFDQPGARVGFHGERQDTIVGRLAAAAGADR